METELVQAKGKAGFRSLLRNRSYVIFLLCDAISRFGDSVDAIAYSWMVYELTGSKLLMGTLFAVNFIPAVIFGLPAGVLADRWNKKKVLFTVYMLRGLVVALTALLYAMGLLETWHLFLFTFLNSTLECFSRPVEMSIVPSLLEKESLLSGNSFLSSVTRTAELAGYAVVGVIISTVGLSGAILLDSLTFIISAILINLIVLNHVTKTESEPAPAPIGGGKLREYGQEISASFKFVRNHRLILTTVILAAFVNFCLTPLNVLQTVYVKDTLSTGATGMSVLSVSLVLGMILGGIWLGNKGSGFKKSTLLICGLLISGVCYSLLSLPPHLPEVIRLGSAGVLFFGMGLGVTCASTPLNTYIMEVTPMEMLGKVGALVGLLCTITMPVGSALSGVGAEWISVPVFFGIMGGLLVIAAVSMLWDKGFREV
ncbi:MFS transporter [Paenibacillus anaericanus]|uniref:MFS transporter n=1 Tax=Paenibacillus anaericanus TaxID=170367 RepID=A0A3S1BJX9_9BACL|nr:MFS transporter [Paenibacillus anaericanus]RUT43327.1 MFS transporter [Paenibacillus anaericanus]